MIIETEHAREQELDKYLDSQEMIRTERERQEEERGRKLEALFSELEDMLLDINKEYRDLEKVTAKEFMEIML